MEDLQAQALDVVLTTEVPQNNTPLRFAAKKISEQPVGLHGKPELLRHKTLAGLLATVPLILPTESTIRAEFENLIVQLDVQPYVAASVDDMAMVRLLAREGAGVALAPSVVLADEIASGTVATAPFDLGFVEPFYAVTLPRKFPHPALADLLGADQPAPP
jgi:LysR family transcriptional activator of nhaA